MKHYFTVGPTHLYPTVQKHITEALQNDIGAVSHRSKKAKAIIKETSDKLRSLLGIPKTHSIFFVSSSLESMERIIQNCVEKKSIHVTCGEFSKKFSSIAQELGKETVLIPYDEQSKPLDTMSFPKKAEMVCLTQNETSTGMWLNPKVITRIKKKHPSLLIAVDVVSSIPYVSLDYKAVDIAFFSVQKGFGMPAGLGILVVSPDALKKAEHIKKQKGVIGSYHSFPSLFDKEQDYQTPETPNLLYIYLLGKVAQDMEGIGLTTIRKQTDEKADMVYDFFDNHKTFTPFLKNPANRSRTTLVIDVKDQTEQVLSYLEKEGFVVSSGYGPFKKDHIRIANFPSHTPRTMKKLLRLINSYTKAHS